MRSCIKHIVAFYLVVFAISAGVAGQDAAFSQFYANTLYLNPGMAGVEGPAKLYIGYRNQWPGAADSYTTYHASYEQYIEKAHGGIGVHVMGDRQGGGIYNTMALDAIYSYHIKLTREITVTGGLQATVGQRSLNTDGVILPDMIDPSTGQVNPITESIPSNSKVYPDFSVGFAGFYRGFFGGVAIHHLHRPYVSPTLDPNTRLERKYIAHIGALIPIYEKRLGKEVLQLSPNLVFIQQASYQQLNYGLEIVYKNLIAGIWGRQDLLFSYGTLIFSAGYGTDNYRFRYSYDAKLASSEIYIPNMGAHELSLIIIFGILNKSKKHRAIKCPKI